MSHQLKIRDIAISVYKIGKHINVRQDIALQWLWENEGISWDEMKEVSGFLNKYISIKNEK